ncbi:MAG: hypothetical protein M3512_01145 [Bacteroidota bacterium]|nr:hypothetical protein [Bacteroidota bacterium]
MTKTAIKNASKGVYHVEFKDFDFNLANTTLTITGFELLPDTARYYQLLQHDSIGPNLFTLYVPEIKVRRINLFSILTGKALHVRDVILKKPYVEVTNHPESVNDSTETFDFNNLFSGKFNSLKIREISLTDLKLKYQVHKEDAPPPFEVSRVNFRLFKLYIDSTTFNDPNKLLYTDDFEFKVFDYTYKLPDSLYTMKVKEVGLSQSGANIYLDSFEMIPRYSPYKFAKKVGIQTDRISLKSNRIEFKHVDMGALLNFQKFIAGTLKIEDINLDVFRDKRYPLNLNRRPKKLHQAIKNLDFYLKLDTIKLVKGNIKYKEHGEESTEAGFLSFDNIYASIYGLTNDSILIKKDKVIADVQAQIYGSTLLKAQFRFDNGHPNGKYEFNGSLSSMDLTHFNKLILPMAHINIESGKLQEASFFVYANDDHAEGTMTFLYDDLKIKVLDKDGETGLKQKITSFVANTFVVKNSNPGNGGVRDGHINYYVEENKSMFYFWGRIMLTGVASSIGISEKMMNKGKEEASGKKENKMSKKS